MIKLCDKKLPKVGDTLKCKRVYNLPSRVMHFNYCNAGDEVIVKKVTYFSVVLVNPRNHARFKLPINLLHYYFDDIYPKGRC